MKTGEMIEKAKAERDDRGSQWSAGIIGEQAFMIAELKLELMLFIKQIMKEQEALHK